MVVVVVVVIVVAVNIVVVVAVVVDVVVVVVVVVAVVVVIVAVVVVIVVVVVAIDKRKNKSTHSRVAEKSENRSKTSKLLSELFFSPKPKTEIRCDVPLSFGGPWTRTNSGTTLQLSQGALQIRS